MAGMKNLRSLSLKWFPAGIDHRFSTRSLLGHLQSLSRLETLQLTGFGLDDTDLRCLSGLPSLNSLNLASTRVTERGFCALTSLKSLRELTIGAQLVSAAKLKSLSTLRHLKSLHIDSSIQKAGRRATLAIDHGDEVQVPEGELTACVKALEVLRRTNPGLAIDGYDAGSDWAAVDFIAVPDETAVSADEQYDNIVHDWRAHGGTLEWGW